MGAESSRLPPNASVGPQPPMASKKQDEKSDRDHWNGMITRIREGICNTFHKPPRRPDLTLEKEKWLQNLKDWAKHGNTVILQLLRIEVSEMEAHPMFKGNIKEIDKQQVKCQPLRDRNVAQLVLAAGKAQEHFEKAVEKLRASANLQPGDIKMGPVKSESRVREKMSELKNSGKDEFAIFDMNRATILCKTHKEFFQVLMSVVSIFSEIMKLKNKFNVDCDLIAEPPCVFFQLTLPCPDVEAMLEPGKKWMVELQITTREIMNVKDISHEFYELLRVDAIPQRCVVCAALAGGPSICLFGETGVGKSCLGNALMGQQVFKASADSKSCTQTAETKVSDEYIIVTDTPGLGDSSGGDQAHLHEVQKHLKNNLKRVDLFGFVLDGTKVRFDEQVQNTFKLYIEMIPNFLEHSVLIFTNWGPAEDRKAKRSQRDRQKVEGDYRLELQKLAPGKKPLPAFFIDSDPDPDEEAEVEATKQSRRGILVQADSLAPYNCENVEAVVKDTIALSAQFKEKQKKLEQENAELKAKQAAKQDEVTRLAREVERLTLAVKQIPSPSSYASYAPSPSYVSSPSPRAYERSPSPVRYEERPARQSSPKFYKGGQFIPGGGRAPKGGGWYS